MGTMPLYITFFYIILISGGFAMEDSPTTDPPISKLLTIERRVSTSAKPIKPRPKPLKCDPAFCRKLGRLGVAAVSPCDPNYCHCDTADRAWLRPCPAGLMFNPVTNNCDYSTNMKACQEN